MRCARRSWRTSAGRFTAETSTLSWTTGPGGSPTYSPWPPWPTPCSLTLTGTRPSCTRSGTRGVKIPALDPESDFLFLVIQNPDSDLVKRRIITPPSGTRDAGSWGTGRSTRPSRARGWCAFWWPCCRWPWDPSVSIPPWPRFSTRGTITRPFTDSTDYRLFSFWWWIWS